MYRIVHLLVLTKCAIHFAMHGMINTKMKLNVGGTIFLSKRREPFT